MNYLYKFMQELLEGVDFTDSKIIILLFTFIIGALVVISFIFFIFYKFKLIIPKSKLFDDEYLQKAVRNYRKLILICRVILVFLIVIDIIWGAMVFVSNTKAPILLFISLGLTPLFIGVVFGRRSINNSFLRNELEFKRQIYNKRTIAKRNDKSK